MHLSNFRESGAGKFYFSSPFCWILSLIKKPQEAALYNTYSSGSLVYLRLITLKRLKCASLKLWIDTFLGKLKTLRSKVKPHGGRTKARSYVVEFGQRILEKAIPSVLQLCACILRATQPWRVG